MEAAAWVSAIAAALSVAFAIGSAVYARWSKRARRDAEDAARVAEESLTETRRLADAAEGEPFEMRALNDVQYRVVNRRGHPVTVDAIADVGPGTRLIFREEPPFELGPYGSMTFISSTGYMQARPDDLVLTVDGGVVHVPFCPPGPSALEKRHSR